MEITAENANEAGEGESAIITFKYLRELQRAERENEGLVQIPNNFKQLLAEYLKRKDMLAAKEHTKNSELKREMENLRPIVSFIFDRREQKIVAAALNTARILDATTQKNPITKNMLPEEEKLFYQITAVLKENREKINEVVEILEGAKATPQQSQPLAPSQPQPAVKEVGKAQDIKSLRIKFLAEVPEIVTADMSSCGPFKTGDIAEVPKDLAEALIKGEKAQKV